MKFKAEELFNRLTAEDGHLVYRTDAQELSLHRELLLPKDYTEEYCRGHYAEILENALRKTGRVYTKLAIRRACRALGLETKLDALLASNGTFRSDWLDAQEIDLDDPYTVQALEAFTAEEFAAIQEELEK